MIIEDTRYKFSHPGIERYVLSCILKNNDLLFEAQVVITAKDFLTETNRNLFSVLECLSRQNFSFDSATIINEANALGLKGSIGGPEYINAIYNTEVNQENFRLYLYKLRDSSVKYSLYNTVENFKGILLDNAQPTEAHKNSDELIGDIQERVIDIALSSDNAKEPKRIDDGIDLYLEELRNKGPVDVLGLPTGFDQLDKSLNGLRPGTLTVVAARPKVGKSMLLQNWAKHIAFNCVTPLLYLDTEMLFGEVRSRLLSNISKVYERDIINGNFRDNPEHNMRLAKAREIMSSGLLFHKYLPHFSPEIVYGLAKKYKVKHNIGALIFDYIKLPDASVLGREVKEYQMLGFLAVALKDMAGELEIPVITAVQIGRSGLIADSDRILRYGNTILELIKKDDEEMECDGAEKGNARLHIIDTRAGRFEDWDGLHIKIDKPIITVEPTGYTYKNSELIAIKRSYKKLIGGL